MNNETIKCPFCFQESPFGVRVCTGCHSTIKYGAVSSWLAVLIGILLLAIAFFILAISQSFILTVVIYFASAISLRFYLRKKFAHRAVFIHKS
ncbi:hypothetical protein [Klebsiella michiganensis]|uniref:hypothetical protein n=1 Tax=Enterobacteriaceae TaxID=543 RepID=UPI0009499DC4|nr:hypothetical protein [Citrobacter farmeri]HAT2777367.1 hypothetical protein [Citrobacter farmeri]HAT2807945.1 hypothetical protein [Citrobacter farmeri]HBC0547762.1 hypothetical protein [Citrobacter farmeri]